MNILDIIALAKAGYTAKDVKELLKVEVNEVNNEPSEAKPEESEEKDIDYKTLYEKSIEEINTLKAEAEKVTNDLKQAQKVNSKSDISNEDTKEAPLEVWENFIKGR